MEENLEVEELVQASEMVADKVTEQVIQDPLDKQPVEVLGVYLAEQVLQEAHIQVLLFLVEEEAEVEMVVAEVPESESVLP